ncbi:hypothetical protein [Prevotella dentasini]|uniref:hypothetical protein n=1 Tax=Prevotella dentasini TaxID=589537 RepID=UPI000B33353F|nr:hypothetical protein [Prevotella dentasini]
MMKRSLYYIGMVVSMLLVLTSCTSDIFESFGGDDATDGVPVTLSFEAAFPGGGPMTRTTADIKNLTLLVFNDKHRYLYRAKATLQEIVDTPSGITFLPDGVTLGPVENKLYKFTVTLMTSTKPRIIHFVADYSKDGKSLDETLPGDHDLESSDEGEVMPGIISTDTEDYSYWQTFYFKNINENSFENKAFKLLRDKAKITVTNAQNSGFELKGYSLHNAPDRGTVVSFQSKTQLTNGPREFYRDVLYTFPIDPTLPTLPSDIVLKNIRETTTNLNPIPVFEYSNSQAERTKQLSVILYGKGNNDPAMPITS